MQNLKDFQSLNIEMLSKAATQARGLAMDAVTACKSGHLGLPLGAAEVGAALFGHHLNFNPEDPDWLNRDRFVLSAGHGSMFLYAWLHLSGFGLSLEEIKNFRKLNSITPGHPESLETPGVECTTGPLGQGVGNSVGMAVAAKMLQAHFNTKDHSIFNHHIVCLCGDGCLQEGVAAEACSLAGHLGLDNYILIYDSNDVTLDAMADKTQSVDSPMRFKSLGFDVDLVNGQDLKAFSKAYQKAANNYNGKPKIIITKTVIGEGIPEVQGTSKAHGEAGIKFVPEARKALGLPDELFYVSDDVKAFFQERKTALKAQYNAWQDSFKAWKEANPQLATQLNNGLNHQLPSDLLERIPHFPQDTAIATRAAGSTVINALAAEVPLLISGSADLHGSTKNYIKDSGDFDRSNHTGRNLHFGIREHGMGAIVNGFGYYGIFRASGATFLVFSDYMRPAIRISALAHLPVFQIFTHDSIGVGEDGPTHQPIEAVASLRLIPNLDVIRPGDPEETAAAFYAALERTDGPTALILTRQNLPILNEIPLESRRKGLLKGGYVAKKEEGKLKLILIATGSELHLALNVAKELDAGVRVVSMPCCERFDRQPNDYRKSILPSSCTKRIAIEAGTTPYWYKYVGLKGKVIGIDRFGLSAPGSQVFEALEITEEALLTTAKQML